jgi:glycosyltransferase involved in cell wall biosynthesis
VTLPQLTRLVMIGTHFPRRCGIATFTSYLSDALEALAPNIALSVVAISDRLGMYSYPERVRFELEEQDAAAYTKVANELNTQRHDMVCLQHEYGIYGGPYGEYVLALLHQLQMPVVTTLHTILSDPAPEQRQILQALCERSARVITISRAGSALLQKVYGVPALKIQFVPHGAPDVSACSPRSGAESLNGDHFTLLSYGLLSVNKGYEDVIKALPDISRQIPNVKYVIIGATHPNILRHEGESYRSYLSALAEELNVSHHVDFVDKFVPQERLLTYIRSADVCITPYRFREQVSSGALSCFVAMGKPVISTPFWYAEEVLNGKRGILVPFGSPQAIAAEVCKVAEDWIASEQMSRRASVFGRDMRWPAVAHTYLRVFASSRSLPVDSGSAFARTPALAHIAHMYSRVENMTDSVGMLQHAKYSIPNYSEGYTTDDNARALIASIMVSHLNAPDCPRSEALATRYMAFMWHAFNREQGRFHNVLGYDRRWLDDVGSEECHGRGLWALGTTLRYATDQGCRSIAAELLELALPATLEFSSLRARAFAIFGLYEYFHAQPSDDEAVDALRQLADLLLDSYRRMSSAQWTWFETSLTYFNAKLCLALLKAGGLLARPDMVEVGLATLEWLTRIQRPEGTHFVPIGCKGFYEKGGQRARFDQQAIDAYATIAACLFAYRITGDERWCDEVSVTFSWFLGNNDLCKPMYDPSTGACFDGLQEDRINLNQGAESTLAMLLSVIELELAGLRGDTLMWR